MKRLLLLSLLLTLTMFTMAQRRIRVIDVETHEPVERASVEPDGHPFTMTDSLGYAVVPEVFDSLTIRHLKYAVERLGLYEVADTVWLFAKENMLDEVTVMSFSTMEKSMKAWLERNKPLPNPSQAALTIRFEAIAKFLGLKSRRQKKREKVKRIMEEWDKMPKD